MTGLLKFGIFATNAWAYTTPEILVRVAEGAEAAGFESLWAPEHVVLPDPRTSSSPLEPEVRLLDPIVTLTFIAAHTRSVRLGTGMIILPQRNPLILAKELASLDVLCNGRLMFGIGIGYLEEEFQALGIPFRNRGARADEYLNAMRAIWNDSKPEYRGQYISFANVQARPQPIQRPNPWLVIGGHSPAALRRTVEQGNGWYGYGLDLEQTARLLDELRIAAKRYIRPQSLGELEITIAPVQNPDPETAKKFADLGVHRLNLRLPDDASADSLNHFFDAINTTLIERV